MKLHSTLDVITNSSSVVYSWPVDKWEQPTEKFLTKVLEAAGMENVNIKDIFDITLQLDSEYVNYILERYADFDFSEDDDEEDYYDDSDEDLTAEFKLVTEYCQNNNIDPKSIYKMKYNELGKLANDMVPTFNEAFQNGQLSVDGYDGEGISNRHYTFVNVKSKINGLEFDPDGLVGNIYEREATYG